VTDRNPGSVLLSDEIERLVRESQLIDPFDRKHLKPASYKLTVGDECSVGGKYKQVAKGKPIFLHPFEVTVIKIHEKVKIPHNLIARWNISVTMAYKGLLWVGGPQVDPGFDGHLLCPIYNLSKEEVILEFNEHIATIDFVWTTPWNDKCVPFAQKRSGFKDYGTSFGSALYTHAYQRLEGLQKTVQNFTSFFLGGLGVILTVIAIIVALMAMIVEPAASKGQVPSYPVWVWVSVPVSIVALVLSIVSIVLSISRFKLAGRGSDGWILGALLVILIILVAFLLVKVYPVHT
jgi:deoxycytidine triphosphate deaminase